MYYTAAVAGAPKGPEILETSIRRDLWLHVMILENALPSTTEDKKSLEPRHTLHPPRMLSHKCTLSSQCFNYKGLIIHTALT